MYCYTMYCKHEFCKQHGNFTLKDHHSSCCVQMPIPKEQHCHVSKIPFCFTCCHLAYYFLFLGLYFLNCK
ncbi:hypothetical protein JHK87_048429 [Glycine soja]|nr:hypothetical protein JHK87_048429 [Glycine soja]